MTLNHYFSFKTRKISSFKVNQKMAKKLSHTLNTIKGNEKTKKAQSGKLNIKRFIDSQISDNGKIDFFDKVVPEYGLNVFFVVDCSLSMLQAGDSLRDITATIFQALQKCPYINFKVIAYSGSHKSHHAMIQEIKSLDDVKYISADYDQRLTPTDLALKYAQEKIQKLEGKKLVILFTDGLPEDATKSYTELQELTKKQIVVMKNNRINFFSVFFRNLNYVKMCKRYDIEDISQKMRTIFKNTMYESEDFNQIEKYLQKKLSQAVEKMNNEG